MLDIDAVEAAIKSDAVLKALNDLIGAKNMMKSAADEEKYVARQVAESEEKTKRARAEYAKARASFAAAIANEVKR